MSEWIICNSNASNGDCYYTGSHNHPRTLVIGNAKSFASQDAADRALALGKRKFSYDWFWQYAEVVKKPLLSGDEVGLLRELCSPKNEGQILVNLCDRPDSRLTALKWLRFVTIRQRGPSFIVTATTEGRAYLDEVKP